MKQNPFKTHWKKLILWGAILLLLVPTAIVWQSWNEVSQSNLNQERSTVAHHLMDLLRLSALERGAGYTVLGGDNTLWPSFQKLGQEKDNKMDLSLKEIQAYRTKSALPNDFDQIIQSVYQGHEKIQNYRPLIQNKRINENKWKKNTTDQIDKIFTLRELLFFPSNTFEDAFYYDFLLASDALFLAEYLGRERAIIGFALASGRIIENDSLEYLNPLENRLTHTQQRLNLMKGFSNTPPPLRQAIDTLNRNFYQDYQKLRHEFYKNNTININLIQSETNQLKEIQTKILDHLRGIENDISGLATTPFLEKFKQNKSQSAIIPFRIQQLLENFLYIHKEIYFKARLLNPQGQEMINIRLDEQKNITIIDANQNKTNRYYFTAAKKLSKGGLYLSRFDLDIENNLIERPFKPTIRYITPIQSDKQDHNFLVLSLRGHTILNNLPKDVILVDQEGFYLHHPNPDKEWGMMDELSRQDQNLKIDFPDLANRILSGQQEAIANDHTTLLALPIRFHNPHPDQYWILLKKVKIEPFIMDSSEWFHKSTEAIDQISHIAQISHEIAQKANIEAIKSFLIKLILAIFMGLLIIALLILIWYLHLAKKRADWANRAKGDFLATMSHEIRTPMNGVLGMTDLLLETKLTDTQKNYLLTIQKSGQMLLRILNDILDLAKIQAGQLTVEMLRFDLDKLLNDSVELFHDIAVRKGLHLSIALPEIIPNGLLGDPNRVMQILFNLLGNAIKFTEKGSITLTVTIIEESAHDLLLHFSLQDTGIGISESYQKNIFQEFSQEDTSISRKYGGTGLGLVIAKKLAILMGGEIGVKSIQGKGSEFWFTIRCGKQQTSDRHRLTTLDQEGVFDPIPLFSPQSKILIVEDNPINQRVTAGFLKSFGCQTTIAEDGKRAVEMITQQNISFNLILMDCEMPRMDGYQATHTIRQWEQENTLPQTPIIALTAHAMEEVRQLTIESGMNDFLCKPFNKNQLEQTIQRWLPKNFQPVENSPSSSIDHHILDQLKNLPIEGEESTLLTMINLLFEQVPARFQTIRNGANKQDGWSIKMAAHSLRSSAATLGALRLAQLSKKIEEHFENTEIVLTTLQDAELEFDQVKRALHKIIEMEQHV
ncbi:MAG: response regulator [Magnetococcus sp. DMHC-6]